MIRTQVGYRVHTVATLSASPHAHDELLTTDEYVDEVPELVDVSSITDSGPGATCPLLPGSEPWIVDTGACSSVIVPSPRVWFSSLQGDAVPRPITALSDDCANTAVVSSPPRSPRFEYLDAALDTCVVMGSTTSPR